MGEFETVGGHLYAPNPAGMSVEGLGVGSGEGAFGTGGVNAGRILDPNSSLVILDRLCHDFSAVTNRSEIDLLSQFIEMKYQSILNTIENLKPSEQEIENRERVKEENVQKRRDREDVEVQQQIDELTEQASKFDELRKLVGSGAIAFPEALAAFTKLISLDDIKLFFDQLRENCPEFI